MADPALSGTYGSYNLFSFEGKYYAVGKEISHENVLETIKEKKALVGDSSEDLIREIRATEDWANSRGMYGLANENESNKKILRANSFNTYEESIRKNYSNPVRLKTEQGIFVVEAGDIGLPSDSSGKIVNLNRDSRVRLVQAVSSNANPELIFQYRHCNIVEYDKVFYGIPLEVGELNLKEANLAEIPGLVSGSLAKEVMLKIDELSLQAKPVNNEPSSPEVINESSKFQWYIAARAFPARVYRFIKRKIPFKLERISPVWRTEFEKLLESEPPRTIRAINEQKVIEYKKRYFLVGNDFKESYLCELDHDELFSLPNSSTLSDMDNILEKKRGSKIETFVKTYGGYNIFLFESLYFAIPEGGREFNFIHDDIMEREDIRNDVSLDALEELISDENALDKEE